MSKLFLVIFLSTDLLTLLIGSKFLTVFAVFGVWVPPEIMCKIMYIFVLWVFFFTWEEDLYCSSHSPNVGNLKKYYKPHHTYFQVEYVYFHGFKLIVPKCIYHMQVLFYILFLCLPH